MGFVDTLGNISLIDIIYVHATYSWNIKWSKWAGKGLNGFIFKKINENFNIKTKKNPGSRLEVSC